MFVLRLPKASKEWSPVAILQGLDAGALGLKHANNFALGDCKIAIDNIRQKRGKLIVGSQLKSRKGINIGLKVGNLYIVFIVTRVRGCARLPAETQGCFRFSRVARIL
jgi:hypothetical protein